MTMVSPPIRPSFRKATALELAPMATITSQDQTTVKIGSDQDTCKF